MVRYYENLGGGLLASPLTTPHQSHSGRSYLVDLDVDGDLDLVGDGLFGFRVPFQPGAGFVNPESAAYGDYLAVGDVNGDGHDDLFGTWHYSSHICTVHLTTPGSLVSTGVGLTVAGGTLSAGVPSIADLNGDGLGDLIVPCDICPNLYWVPSLGGGAFAPARIVGALGGARNTAVGDFNGDLMPDVLCSAAFLSNLTLGGSSCSSTANSTGQPAQLAVRGSRVAMLDLLSLDASGLPPGETLLYLCSTTAGMSNPANSAGTLCLGGAIGRYNRAGEIQLTSPSGTAQLRPSLGDTPTPMGSTAILAGQSWLFQGWYRDPASGTPSNFTSAVEVPFL